MGKLEWLNTHWHSWDLEEDFAKLETDSSKPINTGRTHWHSWDLEEDFAKLETVVRSLNTLRDGSGE